MSVLFHNTDVLVSISSSNLSFFIDSYLYYLQSLSNMVFGVARSFRLFVFPSVLHDVVIKFLYLVIATLASHICVHCIWAVIALCLGVHLALW